MVPNFQQFDQSGSIIQFISIVVVVLGTVLVMTMLNNLIGRMISGVSSSTDILSGTKTAKRRLRYAGWNIKRSVDTDAGLEFSYSFWFYADDWTYKVGKWKHLFHKGGVTYGPDDPIVGTIIKCPGVWLDPNENVLHIFMNTYQSMNEQISVSNIPLNKWVNCIMTVQGRNIDIYINGEFIKRSTLESLPRQNYGDVLIAQSRGFSGFLSRIKYFNYSISYNQIEDIVRYGPARTPCQDSGEVPPY